ncbi:uncharacterized protein B0I36DRAFT_347759 [Microdochium trichocladiopsis]|uniref:NmrA-like domain-containing protein n=1 Tax=Microdochium trichocladiopsis TaxID=1682393 RepID=A0A9P8Y7I7_9PEZI|nr:uncharacterized protein B0I36DRAFT_347759 [Microdochium trichocladiopsis]KAH7032567.1 hypothetical protein B0I36DRAFT_347759 [Microdochium trichocladiopsis]
MARYAKDQPDGFTNAIESVAIVGAGGTVGSRIVSALVEGGKHTVTALSRKGSPNKIAPGVQIATIDYDDETSIVEALRGQQCLIITLAPAAPPNTHSKLVHAASKAGVPYIVPNNYGGDIDNVKMGQETMLGPVARANRAEIERLGMQWITIACGFWYDYSLAGSEWSFGFDFAKRAVTFYDDGSTYGTFSTLAQVGRAVAKVLSLKELPDDEGDKGPTLSSFLGKAVYVQSFRVNQREMLESVKRVTGTTDADWKVSHVDSKKRYEEGLAQVQSGDRSGFIKLLYARGFYPDDPADFSAKTQNELLGLPEESLDVGTRAALAIVQHLQSLAKRTAA